MRTWTKPYYGVSHLRGLSQGFQITLTEIWGRYIEAEVYLLTLKANNPFSARREFSGTLGECKAYGEKWAEGLALQENF